MTIKLIKTHTFVISPHSVGCLGHLILAGSTDLWNLLATQLVLFGLREPQLRLPLSVPGLSSSRGLPQSWSHGSSVPREQECCFCKASCNLSIKLTLLSHSVGQRKVTGLPRVKGWRHIDFSFCWVELQRILATAFSLPQLEALWVLELHHSVYFGVFTDT